MPRYIDRDVLVNFANNQVGGITANHIMRFPTADVKPVRHGRWEQEKCTECGKSLEDLFSGEFYYDYEEVKFCPNCGAKMDKEE